MMRALFIAISITASLAAQDYVLGPDDQVKIWALGFEEITDKPVRVDPTGFIDIPMLGRLKAVGLTTAQLETALIEQMKKSVRQPQVSVEIVEFGSQPVSVIGAVNMPGVHQLRGRKTLAEMLSMAGGLRIDAGSSIKITRELVWGPIPLKTAAPDATGKFTTGDIKTTDLLVAKNPADNILIRPHDVITVPVAESIAVIGAVRKPGTFLLNNRPTVSALEALSLAEGLGPTPQPQNARILRPDNGGIGRKEIPVNLQKILAGKAEDIALRPNDILLVPTSMPKKAGMKAAEAVLSAAVGMAIWRVF
jgi:polysaccharide biosynthesis/export protein